MYKEEYKEKCFELVSAYDLGGTKNITKRIGKGVVSGRITEPRTAKYEAIYVFHCLFRYLIFIKLLFIIGREM